MPAATPIDGVRTAAAQKYPPQLEVLGGFRRNALAAFVTRPQAVAQIGAMGTN
jgi:hypothetical protein